MTKLRLSGFGHIVRRPGALGGPRAAGKEGTEHGTGRAHERSHRPAEAAGAGQRRRRSLTGSREPTQRRVTHTLPR